MPTRNSRTVMKKFFLSIVTLTIAISASSQVNLKLEIHNFDKFMKVNAENVNLRKAPDAQSALLLEWNNDGGEGTQYYPVFSDENLKYLHDKYGFSGYTNAIHPYAGEILPLLSESNGWSKIVYTCGMRSQWTYHRSREAYMMSKFGEKHELVEGVTLADLNEDYNFASLHSDRFSGIGFAVKCHESYADIYIAIPVDGIYIWVMDSYWMLIDTDDNEVYFRVVEGYDDFAGEKVMYNAIKTDLNAGYDLATKRIIETISSLSDNEIEVILNEFIFKDKFKYNTPGRLYAKTDKGAILNIPTRYENSKSDVILKTIELKF